MTQHEIDILLADLAVVNYGIGETGHAINDKDRLQALGTISGVRVAVERIFQRLGGAQAPCCKCEL